jgi:uncharacterized protein YbjT (DUF2867 family)
LTGANGYIGLRLLPELLARGHHVFTIVRDRRRLPVAEFEKMPGRIETIELDLLESPLPFPKEIDVAYYLVHSLGSGGDFASREEKVAQNFAAAIARTECRQLIFLGGVLPNENRLSPHLRSRRRVEELLSQSTIPLTALRASIIVGSGSASFEIIRDLIEKLPIMLAPRWTRNLCQPIAIRNVIGYLLGVALMPQAFGRVLRSVRRKDFPMKLSSGSTRKFAVSNVRSFRYLS